MKRTLTLFLVLTLIVAALSSCGKTKYRDDVEISKIADTITSKVPLEDGYYAVDSDYITFYFEGAESLISDHRIMMSTETSNINQFGVFHVKPGNAEAMKKLCESYIATMRDRWGTSAMYIPAELTKLDNAEVRIYGNYVIYLMMTPSDKTTVFAAVEGLLK